MDDVGRARITDFGLATVTQNLDSMRGASGGQSNTARWTAPEILNEEGTFSKESDVFSFAMVMIEVHYEWFILVELWLTAYCTTTGIYRCGSVQEYPARGSYVCGNDRQAPVTADAPCPHRPAMGVDTTLLGSEPSLAPGGFRCGQGFTWLVSSLFGDHTFVDLPVFSCL